MTMDLTRPITVIDVGIIFFILGFSWLIKEWVKGYIEKHYTNQKKNA